jgi:hypothetical protein
MNNELEGIRKEIVMAQLRYCPCIVSGGTEEILEKPQDI